MTKRYVLLQVRGTWTLLISVVVVASTAGCGSGESGSVARSDSISVAKRLAAHEDIQGFRKLQLTDILSREAKPRVPIWLIRFRVHYTKPPRDETDRRRRPGDWCVIVWAAGQKPVLPREAEVPLRPLVRVGRFEALSDECPKAEHIVGPLP